MRDPEQAAHALGKLIKHCGEDNVLWGTDSIWYGSPQDQIVAFRTFQISASSQGSVRLCRNYARRCGPRSSAATARAVYGI